MVHLTQRDRIIRAVKRREIDRIPMLDTAWAGTVRRWYNEGMPKGISWEKHFGFDNVIRIFPDNSPRYPIKVIEQTDRYRIETTKWGETRKVFNELDSTPEALDFYYKTPEKWEEAKKEMLTYHEDRIPWKLLERDHAKWKADGRFKQLIVWFGFDVAHSRLTGTENMLVSMYDDPDWVTDIFDTYLKTSLDLCQRILDAGYEFDAVYFMDDMGYKGSTFFSPEMYPPHGHLYASGGHLRFFCVI